MDVDLFELLVYQTADGFVSNDYEKKSLTKKHPELSTEDIDRIISTANDLCEHREIVKSRKKVEYIKSAGLFAAALFWGLFWPLITRPSAEDLIIPIGGAIITIILGVITLINAVCMKTRLEDLP